MNRLRDNTVKPARKGLPRTIEALLSATGLVVFSPLVGFAALMVVLSSPGPILYRQQRVGLGGCKFTLYKLRSMKVALPGPAITAKDDSRITRLGRFLRKTKIDELPELWNVLKGEMSFVGPRPEVEQYVGLENRLWREVLQVRPGITDPVAIALRNEEDLLGRVDGDRERFYLEKLQPFKLEGYLTYLQTRSAWRDLKVILETLFVVLFQKRRNTLERHFPRIL